MNLQQSSTPVIEVEDLSFRFDTGPPVLEDVNLEIAAGDFASVIGPQRRWQDDPGQAHRRSLEADHRTSPYFRPAAGQGPAPHRLYAPARDDGSTLPGARDRCRSHGTARNGPPVRKLQSSRPGGCGRGPGHGGSRSSRRAAVLRPLRWAEAARPARPRSRHRPRSAAPGRARRRVSTRRSNWTSSSCCRSSTSTSPSSS